MCEFWGDRNIWSMAQSKRNSYRFVYLDPMAMPFLVDDFSVLLNVSFPLAVYQKNPLREVAHCFVVSITLNAMFPVTWWWWTVCLSHICLFVQLILIRHPLCAKPSYTDRKSPSLSSDQTYNTPPSSQHSHAPCEFTKCLISPNSLWAP